MSVVTTSRTGTIRNVGTVNHSKSVMVAESAIVLTASHSDVIGVKTQTLLAATADPEITISGRTVTLNFGGNITDTVFAEIVSF